MYHTKLYLVLNLQNWKSGMKNPFISQTYSEVPVKVPCIKIISIGLEYLKPWLYTNKGL